MATDPAVRQEAENVLGSVFRGLGNRARGEEVGQVGNVDIGGLIGQVEEFVSMPLDLATLFLDMSVDLTKMILNALEEAGFILVKGMTPL